MKGEKHDCKVQAVAALVDRSGGRVDFHVPFISLLKLDIETFVPEDCPLCRADKPLHSAREQRQIRLIRNF